MPQINETPYSRFATQIHDEITKPLRTKLIGRRLATIDPKVNGDGITSLEIFSIGEMSDAFISYELPDGSSHKDSLTSTADIIKIPVLHKEFQIQKSEVLAWENRKVSPGQENSIDSITAQAATYQVSKKEEATIIVGWAPNGTKYEIPGFWEAANNSVAGGSVSTVGDLYGYVADAIGKLNDDDVFGDNDAYNVVLPSSINSALKANIYSASGIREYALLNELLNGGQILVSNLIAKNNGTSNAKDGALVLPVDASREHFQFENPVDYRVEFANPKYPSLSPLEGVVYSLIRPYFKRTNASGKTDASCKITGLSVS